MDIQELVRAQRAYFDTGATRPFAFRLAQLKKLQQALRDNEQLLEQAMMQDFRKAPMEVYMCETGMVLEELRFHLKHLKGWMRERAVPTPLAQFPSKSFVSPEPYGADYLAVELPRAAVPVAAGRRDLRRQLRRRQALGLRPGHERSDREAHPRDL